MFWIGIGFSTDGQSGLFTLADFSLTVPLKKTRLTVDRGENTIRLLAFHPITLYTLGS